MGQSPASGQVFAGYRIERLLGAGGMGEVFLATDRDLPRFVALKLLGRDRKGDPEVVARFRREAAAAALSGTGAPATTMRSPAPRRRGRGGGRRRRRTLALVTALTVVFAICGTVRWSSIRSGHRWSNVCTRPGNSPADSCIA